MKNSALVVAITLFCSASGMFSGAKPLQAQETSAASLARRIGSIKAIQGNIVTLTPDNGPDLSVAVQPNARILRIAPGAKDLTNATPVALQDLKTGDRVRVRGQAGSDPNSISALEIIVMARTDLDARRQQEQQDWQRRGVGGLVANVDTATGTVTISVTGFSGKKDIAVHTTGSTVFRRYAAGSVKFDDAKPSTLAEIRAGDQLRARGQRSSDGLELTAEEIVTGSFRNVAGTVVSVDTESGTVNVHDLLTKQSVAVKVTPDSQLHKLPPEFAQHIAMRLKGAMLPGTPASSSAAKSSQSGPPSNTKPSETGMRGAPGAANGGMAGGARMGGDFQQILSRMPALTLSDLHKGDALLIVATQGSASAGATAITMLSGVEPILEAAPSQAMMLTPWSLGGAPGGEGAQ